MRLTTKAIADFKQIYQTHFGNSIEDDEAEKLADNFLGLMSIVLRPVPHPDFPKDKGPPEGEPLNAEPQRTTFSTPDVTT